MREIKTNEETSSEVPVAILISRHYKFYLDSSNMTSTTLSLMIKTS